MTTYVVADPAAAMCAYLAATIPEVLDTTTPPGGVPGPAVFRPRIPEWAQSEDPLACIVVRRAGGYKLFGTGRIPVADPTIDLTCYAHNAQQADMIATTAANALKQLTMSVWEGCTLYWASISGGPIPLPDTQALWPATWLSFQMMHSEMAVAA